MAQTELDSPPLKKLRTDDGGVEVSAPTVPGDGDDDGDLLGSQHPSSPRLAPKESDVGISEFVSGHEGFFAVLKRRYSDFLVQELSKEGEVVKLTSRSLPLSEIESELDADEASLVHLLGAERAASIKELSGSSDKAEKLEIEVSLDKGERTLLHKTMRALYPLLESETVVVDAGGGGGGGSDARNILIQHSKRKSQRKSGAFHWPRERGSYCRFVLYKENKDTMDAVNIMSRLLKLKSSCFHYAGTKDKRAITSQLLTAFKVTAEKLQTLNPKLRNMQLGNFKYVSAPLKLGCLSGNKFTVVLRNVSCDNRVIAKAVTNLGEAGFVNYYGMQRFGTSAIPTHHVGRCLVHSDWKGAIDLIMKPRAGESEDLESARKYYESSGGDAVGTLSRLPKSRYVERQLLQGLQKHASLNNYVGALNFIPRNVRLIYVHSWQSYCWNKLASWRLRELGLAPVIGDLVIKSSSSYSSSHDATNEPILVTASNQSEYSIHDVVLPLPGYSIKLPTNKVKDEYDRILSSEGVVMENLKHRVKDISLVGSYRHIVQLPKDISWEPIHYDDLTVPLVLTDLDHLSGRRPPQSAEGSLKAVKVEFSLPPASYATMAIRELTRMDTTPAYQTTLQDS